MTNRTSARDRRARLDRYHGIVADDPRPPKADYGRAELVSMIPLGAAQIVHFGLLADKRRTVIAA